MYHGFADSVSSGPNLISIPWNDIAALEQVLAKEGHAIAAVITEPVMCNEGCVLPQDGYLQSLSSLVRSVGAVLIFDEVITGFRVGLSGAQGRFGIQPDLTVLGKAIGGGYPVACVGGRAEIMELVTSGVVPMLGTYAGNGIAIAAADACVELYTRREADVEQLFTRAEALRGRLEAFLATTPMRASVTSFGPVMQFAFATEHERRSPDLFARFWRSMVEQHILIHPSQDEVIFLSLAHDEEDLARFEHACRNAIEQLVATASG
jgi:glutamate-1-semialdehyde 2,1-aminomutase